MLRYAVVEFRFLNLMKIWNQSFTGISIFAEKWWMLTEDAVDITFNGHGQAAQLREKAVQGD